MKNALKQLTTFGCFIIGLFLFLTNCQQESINDDQNDSSELAENGTNNIIKTGKFNDFKDLTTFIEKIKKKRENEISRTSIEDNNDFTILEDRDIYSYTDSTSTTYTIAIQKENQNAFEFSNLVVKFNDNEPTTTYILNYVPSQDYLNSYDELDQTPFQGTINYESIDYDGSLDNLNEKTKCKTITLTYCDYGGDTHAAGDNCTPDNMFDVTYTICYESSDGTPLNESIDPPSGDNGGGGSTENSDPTKPLPTVTCEDSEGNIGLTGSNGDCYTSEAIGLVEELEAIVGEDNYDFDSSLTDYEVISFDDMNEFEEFYNSLFSDVSIEPYDSQSEDGQTETKIFSYNFGLSIFSYTFKVEVEASPPSSNSCNCMQVNDVTTILIGNTTLVDWNQIGDYTTQVSNDGSEISVFTRGTMTIGVKIEGYPFNITELVTFVQVFNYETGYVVNYYMIRE